MSAQSDTTPTNSITLLGSGTEFDVFPFATPALCVMVKSDGVYCGLAAKKVGSIEMVGSIKADPFGPLAKASKTTLTNTPRVMFGWLETDVENVAVLDASLDVPVTTALPSFEAKLKMG